MSFKWQHCFLVDVRWNNFISCSRFRTSQCLWNWPLTLVLLNQALLKHIWRELDQLWRVQYIFLDKRHVTVCCPSVNSELLRWPCAADVHVKFLNLLLFVSFVYDLGGGGIIKTHCYPCSFQLEPCPDLCCKLSVAPLMAHSSYLMVLRSQAELDLWKSIGHDVFTIVTSKQRASNRIPGRRAGGKSSSLFSPTECDTQVTSYKLFSSGDAGCDPIQGLSSGWMKEPLFYGSVQFVQIRSPHQWNARWEKSDWEHKHTKWNKASV